VRTNPYSLHAVVLILVTRHYSRIPSCCDRSFSPFCHTQSLPTHGIQLWRNIIIRAAGSTRVSRVVSYCFRTNTCLYGCLLRPPVRPPITLHYESLYLPTSTAALSDLYVFFEELKSLSSNYTVISNMASASMFPTISAAIKTGRRPPP
jgi:hypothetical protein